jgi:hypothetical protein
MGNVIGDDGCDLRDNWLGPLLQNCIGIRLNLCPVAKCYLSGVKGKLIYLRQLHKYKFDTLICTLYSLVKGESLFDLSTNTSNLT